MKKFSLHITHPNHRSVFAPVVGIILHQRLKNYNPDCAKRSKVDWKTAINQSDFLCEVQVRLGILSEWPHLQVKLLEFAIIRIFESC